MRVCAAAGRFALVAAALAAAGGRGGAQTVLVKPYVQPGDPRGADEDALVVAWVTDQVPGDFAVEYSWAGAAARTAAAARVSLDFAPPRPKAVEAAAKEKLKERAADPAGAADHAAPAAGPEKEQHYFKYAAVLAPLPLDAAVRYTVRLGGREVRGGTVRTRASADKPVRFVAVGDLANGRAPQNAVANQIALADPDFLLALGDIVYPNGRVRHYMDHFWRTYNDVDAPGPKAGAPLMATVPFHVTLGNHDVDARPAAFPDALGAYYFFHAPANGPGAGPWLPPLSPDRAEAAAFRAAAGAAYPALGFYSFDRGPAHVLVFDNNGYVKADAPALVRWVEDDLARSKAKWKFVCLHAPLFHSSPQHYTDQKSRLLAPAFERGGVDVVFAGHVHNYQRSHPLRFAPLPRAPGERLVTGTFALDTAFDGRTNTRPAGVLHVVSGGGGATLYADPFEKTAAALKAKYGDNWAPFTAKHVADRHSFVVCDLTPGRLVLRAVDSTGGEFDRVVVTKP